jgi:hypothetical protein
MGNLGLSFINPAPQVRAASNLFSPCTSFGEKTGAKFFEQRLGTLVLGLIIPDLKQVDLLGTNILPQLKGML